MVVQAAIWYLFSNILVKGLGFLSTPVFTRIMSKAEYGEFTNFVTWENILFILVSLQLHTTVPRAKYDFEERLNEYLTSITAVSNAAALLLYLFVEYNHNFFETFLGMDIVYIRVLFLYLFFAPAFSFLQIQHRMDNKYIMFTVLAVFSALIREGISVFLVICMQNKLLGRLIGYVVPIMAINIAIWLFIVIRGRYPSFTHMKYAIALSIPMVFHAMAGNLLGSSDRLMIKQMIGAEETAVYTVPYTAATMLNLIWNALNQAWTPWLYGKIHEGHFDDIRAKSRIYFGVYAVFIFPVLLMAPEIIWILAGKEYYEARYIMPPVIISSVFQFIYGMYVNLETYEKKNWLVAVGTFGAALINIVLNLSFIPRFGYFAAAYTTLVGYFCLLCFHAISVWRMGKYRELYDLRFIGVITISVFFLHFVCMFLYSYIIVRYILLGIYTLCVLIICRRVKVMSLLRGL